MMEKMIALQQKRRSKKGGFTLVELIVVLVILAILAALLIPALTGYIDKAKEKNVIAETRQIVMAAQTVADEAYGAKTTVAGSDLKKTDVASLSEVTLDGTDVISISNGKVAFVQHKGKNGKSCWYKDGTYSTTTQSKTQGTTYTDFT